LGAILGLILPGIVFFLTEILKKDLSLFDKENVFYLLSLTLNFFMVRYYFKSDKEDTAKGIVLSTFTSAFIFFFFKLKQ
jgi:hypothetical protein